MKHQIFTAVLSLVFSSQAFASTVPLKGDAADSFIDRHFRGAEIPGPVEGFFIYVGKRGNEKEGYAKCFSPAMGSRSEGAVTTCAVDFDPRRLKGEAASLFIDHHFPDASIPGGVEGEFTYVSKAGDRKTGRAKCFSPAMGGRSGGAVTTCTVVY